MLRDIFKMCITFFGHNEYEMSIYKWNLLEILGVIQNRGESIWKATLQNALQNQKVAPSIQKEIVQNY